MTSVPHQLAAVQKYDRTSIILHWTIALILVGDGVLALLLDNWPREQRPPILNIHALFGILVLLLTLWRIANRVTHPAPPLPPGEGYVETAAKAVQGLLYLATIVIPLTGVVTLWLRGAGVDFGVFQIPPMLTENRTTARSVKEVHETLFWITMVLAAGHAGAAIWHQVFLKDNLIARMKL